MDEASGENARFEVFGDQVGLDIADGVLGLPDGEVFTNGDECPDGPGRVALFVWEPDAAEGSEPDVITEDIGATRFAQDGQRMVLAFRRRTWCRHSHRRPPTWQRRPTWTRRPADRLAGRFRGGTQPGSVPVMVQYLSDEWLQDAGAALAESPTLAAAAADLDLTIQYEVTGGPNDRAYGIRFDHGSAGVEAGPHKDAPVSFAARLRHRLVDRQGRPVGAVGLHQGRLKLGGDVGVLIRQHAAFEGLDDLRRRPCGRRPSTDTSGPPSPTVRSGPMTARWTGVEVLSAQTASRSGRGSHGRSRIRIGPHERCRSDSTTCRGVGSA